MNRHPLSALLLAAALTACMPELENENALDADGDGYTAFDGDCNDNDPMTYPGAAELAELTMTEGSRMPRPKSKTKATESLVAG